MKSGQARGVERDCGCAGVHVAKENDRVASVVVVVGRRTSHAGTRRMAQGQASIEGAGSATSNVVKERRRCDGEGVGGRVVGVRVRG